MVVHTFAELQLPRGGVVITVSGRPLWPRIVRVTVAVVGTFCVWITTSTGDDVLRVRSGNVEGFGVIVVPLIVSILAVVVPAVGSNNGNGNDKATLPNAPENVSE